MAGFIRQKFLLRPKCKPHFASKQTNKTTRLEIYQGPRRIGLDDSGYFGADDLGAATGVPPA